MHFLIAENGVIGLSFADVFTYRNGPFPRKLSRDDPAYELEASDNGYLLIRNDGQDESFNALARELIDGAGEDFAVFPTPDGHKGYERVFVIPI